MIAAEWGVGEVVIAFLAIALFAVWIFLVINIFGDIVRSDDLSGWGKGLWAVAIVVLPYLGVLAYLVARGGHLSARMRADAAGRGGRSADG